jgi:choline dehydrogenase-like flavoprotein
VLYFDAEGREQAQKAKAVVLSANGAETARLLLMSASSRFPQGLGNGSGLVGKHLMWNAHAVAMGAFEHPLNEWKSVQCSRIVTDFYAADPQRGHYGGGVIDARPLFGATPLLYAMTCLPPDTPHWGSGLKKALAFHFNHNVTFTANATSLPLESNNITLDPELKDHYGRPAMRVTYEDHADDLATAKFLQDVALRMLDAAGAQKTWTWPVQPQTDGAHLLGTCRMGNDAQHSVVDRFHRSHEVPNLFICDGSSMVTSGRGQPTMTIMALAFRAGEHIAAAARRGEV